MNTLLKLKSSVDSAQLKPELLLAIQVAFSIWNRSNEPVLTITSTTNYSVDLKIRELQNDPVAIVRCLMDALTDDYLVLLKKDYIHVAYRPTWKP